jgi:uncharacterized protein YukE
MGSFFQTIKNYFGVKMDQAQDGVVGALVKLDTESAIMAEVQRLEQELDKETSGYVQARREYEREQKEADQATATYNRMLSAAEDLDAQSKAAAAAGQPEAAAIQASLDKLLGKLEGLRPEVEREVAESKQAKAYMDQLQQYLETIKKDLQGYKTEVEKAKREMKSAEMEKKLAQKMEDQAMKLAGIQQRSSNLKIVLDKINEQTQEAKDVAAKSKMKVEMFSPKQEDEDPLITAALAKASGTVKPTNMSERLEALKKGISS